MKRLKAISPIIALFVSFSCMTEREEDNSFYLNQISRIQVNTAQQIFFSENVETSLNLDVRYFDESNRPLFANQNIPYELFLTDSLIDSPTLNLSRPGNYTLKAAFPTRERTFSNGVEIQVVGPEYIQEVRLDYSNETRNSFAVAENNTLDFTVKVFGPEGEITGLEDQIFRNLEIQLGNQSLNRLDNIRIRETGSLDVVAKIFGVESNTLKIESREDIVYPIKEMPIIFHVFSNGPNINAAQMNAEINKLNANFSNATRTSFRSNVNAVNGYFRFRLADRDPEGNTLSTIGYNRIEVSSDFSDDSPEYLQTKFDEMWDPNRYINVFIENIGFAAGYAYLPTLSQPAVPGLAVNSDAEPTINYPYSISLDYRFAIEQSNPNPYVLGHEMGHYLGLYHTFNDCNSGDFVDDTNPHSLSGLSPVQVFNNNRTSCLGENFISTNFMDYVIDVDHFTFDQRERMNAVYENGLFIPRQENQSARMLPLQKGILDSSIKPIICEF
ncbi:M43 family zinc metalloprotease [Mongoliibacter ruber]|uniref:Pregnancy-associated plasma protein-A n=1 Tax=Mongoliibacter ruber TaxID=1750599 RepID=A0A2T0WLJ8_9BACT|nr:M43 family zinc metalloprotease [Mongoliibacter ruber]PRY87579.1 pregnancy-associated plasma protein-A [Mongoliibacter ruber]